jgi:hypothetical protein
MNIAFTLNIPVLAWWQWALIAACALYCVGIVAMWFWTGRLKLGLMWPAMLLFMTFGNVQ